MSIGVGSWLILLIHMTSFFKEVLSRQEAARDFILRYLPSDIVGLFDIKSLEIRGDRAALTYHPFELRSD